MVQEQTITEVLTQIHGSEWLETVYERDFRTNEYMAGQEQHLLTIRGKLLASTPTYTVDSVYTEQNNKTAYILSAGKNWVPSNYNKSNYETTVSDNAGTQDIQYALWKNKPEYNEGKDWNSNIPLYNEAEAYANFYNNYIKNGYEKNVSINLNTQSPKIIVNKLTGTYTVGPYVMMYPDDARFAFVEDMYVKDQNGNKIDIRVISEDGNTYPKSGKSFFIEFSYHTNPTKVTLCAQFAYLQNVYSKYTRMVANDTPIYRYEGKVYATMNLLPTVFYEAVEIGTVPGAIPYSALPAEWKAAFIENKGNSKIWYKETEKRAYDVYYKYNINLIQATDSNGNPITYDAQVCARISNTEKNRTWNTIGEISTTDTVDISMQVGGKVFVDEPAGKEGSIDGIYNADSKDKPMSGITVHLYSRNLGGEIASTKTDGNGNYVFKALSVLDQYYVKFDYNSQYYEPTYYATPNTSGDYKNTSNGTEYVTDRNTVNARFASINSSPANYYGLAGYNKTYSKKDLLGYTLNSSGEYVKTNTAVIDEFGNLILTSSSNTELQKKIQYVKDCQMSSWTKSNGANTTDASDDSMDLYPVSSVLVITQYYDRLGGNLQSSDVNTNWADTSNYATTISTIGGSIDDKSQYINQGLKLRQEADISLKEDIDGATIEINGKSQDYKYNVREAGTQDDSKWEISVRLSDGYYNTTYSRELYSSDYQYKVSGYDDPAKYGKTK